MMTEPIHHSPTQDRSRAPGLPRTLVPPSFFNVPSAINDWHYESRRVAQSILPHLFLGPMSVVKDEKFIEENNIKLVLGTTSPQMWQIMKQRYAGRPQFQALPVAGTADLVKMFPKSKAIIDTTLQNEGAVLVYCETGNEISAAVVVAYIMETNKYDALFFSGFMLCSELIFFLQVGSDQIYPICSIAKILCGFRRRHQIPSK